jgi:hypothetical protein
MAQQRVIVQGWAQESKKSQKVVHYPMEKNELLKFEGPYKSGRYVVLGSSTFVCMRNLTKVEDILLFWDLPLL